MRRPVAAAVVLATITALSAQHASAAAPKQFTHTYYFHGSNMSGNVDQAPVNGSLMTMDGTKPSGSSAKEFAIIGYGGGPNPMCGGNNLFPNFVGTATGNIVGKAKVTFWVRSTPAANIEVRLFPDTTTQACNTAYPDPIGDVTVAAPAGATPVPMTVTVPILGKGKVAANLTVQISAGSLAGPLTGPQVTGISYDATTALSSITFTCTPKKGKKSC